MTKPIETISKIKGIFLDKKDIKELLSVIQAQLQHGHYFGGGSTTETEYWIKYEVFKKY